MDDDPILQEAAQTAYAGRLEADDWAIFLIEASGAIFLIEASGGAADGKRGVLLEFRGAVPAVDGQGGRVAVFMPVGEMRDFLSEALDWLDGKVEERGW